jgi:membrane-associated phospholipid phosphatase
MSWAALIQIRPGISDLHCATTATACTLDSIPFWLDRKIVGLDSPLSNTLSFVTEYAGGLLAILAPWIIRNHTTPSTQSRPRRPLALNFLLLAEGTLLNGVFMETCRNLVQRPRPFVYEAPSAYGRVVSHYTSFYSGHTSFTAVAVVTAWAAVHRSGATPRQLKAVAALGASLVFLTGLFRVLAARHFVTDVLFGALAGASIACLVQARHARQRTQTQPSATPPS